MKTANKSKSTDKLIVLEEIISNISSELSEDKMDKIQSIQIGWDSVVYDCENNSMVCPNLTIRFFE